MSKVDLQRVLDLDAQATEGPWDSTTEIGLVHEDTLWSPVGSTQADVPEATADAELIAYYRTAAPAMAKAIRAVLDLHVMYWDGSRQEYVCRACQLPARWPTNTCPTVQPLYEHLGEQP